MSLTLPYRISFRLKRSPEDTGGCCTFRWAPQRAFFFADLQLLRITAQGPEEVPVEPQTAVSEGDQTSATVQSWDSSFKELQPGAEIVLSDHLHMHYQQKLVPGERYQLFWPGGEIDFWTWGTRSDSIGKTLKRREMDDLQHTRLVIPPSNRLLFVATEAPDSWPNRPETKSNAQFQAANRDELQWRRLRALPPPPPLGPVDRVLVLFTIKNAEQVC